MEKNRQRRRKKSRHKKIVKDGNEKWESGTERLIERTSHTSAQ